jgi:thioredoxin 1
MSVNNREVMDIDQSNFDREVLESREPVLVDFSAGWCGPCKALGPVLDDIARTYSGRVKVFKVDVDQNSDLAGRFGIRSIPTLLYFAGGQVRRQTVGAVSRREIVNGLEAVGVGANN